MITIIKEGSDERPTYKRTCPECGCEFTYQFSDTIPSGWNGGYTMIHCPHCKYPVAHLIAGGNEDINHPKLTD